MSFKSRSNSFKMHLKSFQVKLSYKNQRGLKCPYFCACGVIKINTIKAKSMAALTGGLEKFENSKDIVKNADFKSLETFIKQYLNTADKKQRAELSEEFRKRHLELYEFLKSNSELVNAETEINKMISDALQGMTKEKENQELNNLFETIRESEKS